MRHVVAAFGAFHSLAQTVGSFRMIRPLIIGMAAALAIAGAPTAGALAADDEAARQAALTERFSALDKVAEDGWEQATPTPLFLVVASDKAAGAPLNLKPGAYRIVVFCDCNDMAVTLVGPDAATVPPERSDANGAMYSLDVREAGSYLAGIDMHDCGKDPCEIAVKVYRKKV
jgi:hypothetical protein